MALHESVYPAEWSDDQVMDVLFSPFRENRRVNPRSWDSKLSFWTDMIRRYFSYNKLLIFNARQLPVMFERNGKVPACLKIVLEDLTKYVFVLFLKIWVRVLLNIFQHHNRNFQKNMMIIPAHYTRT